MSFPSNLTGPISNSWGGLASPRRLSPSRNRPTPKFGFRSLFLWPVVLALLVYIFPTDKVACGQQTNLPAPQIGETAAGPCGISSVRDFGAIGDGKTDDTVAVEKAIRTGRSVYFPPGSYLLTRTIEIRLAETGFVSLWGDGTARVVMGGPGPAFRFVGTHTGTAAPRTVHQGVWQQERMPVVSGLEIVGQHPQAGGIEATGTMQLSLRGLNIRETYHAVRLFNRNRNVVISDCHIYKNLGVGILLDDCDLHQINISGCHISYNAQGGIVSRAGNVRNIHVTGCDIENNMPLDPAEAKAAPPTANILIDGTGGKYGTAEVAITGCTIQHTHEANDSANIRFIGEDAAARRWGHLVIANNVLSDVQVNIDLYKARGVSIVGNTFWQGAEWNLRAVDCDHILLGPNMMDRNPGYEAQLSGCEAVVFQNCRHVSISGLHLSGVRRKEAGIILESCENVNINGCFVVDCQGAGILVRRSSGVHIVNSRFIPPQEQALTWLPVRIEESKEIIFRPQD
ncbi:MAG: right-handed parallel beta-helix repeat-containing protein [Thermoguttaceae bacterium]|nr:right-handed parallel beta-helix repeat-containing protein [Thermoguttaceae bacterium]MDW8078484.1 right-handed parallel beta-helix repeat-containing protein [Thermoguttaceae bacterium]